VTPIKRRHLMGLLGATAFSGCAPAIVTSKIGDDPFEGGIGGTGIVGLMTGRGSVLVNGLRVEIPARARIMADGRTVSDSVLVAGMALGIVARARAGRFEALRIEMDTPLVGTLLRQGAGVAVNGTPLRLEAGVLATPLVGRRVMAHGLWQADGSLRSSLLRAATAGNDRVAGVVTGTRDQGWRIGKTDLRVPGGQVLVPGQFAVASGVFSGGALVADAVTLGRFRGGQPLRQLSIEGYLEPIDAAPGFRIAGLGHSFDRRLALDPFAAQRAIYFGDYDGRFRARSALALPESAGARQALLQPDADTGFAAALTGAARPVGLK
jgi:hypothetical protein